MEFDATGEGYCGVFEWPVTEGFHFVDEVCEVEDLGIE